MKHGSEEVESGCGVPVSWEGDRRGDSLVPETLTSIPSFADEQCIESGAAVVDVRGPSGLELSRSTEPPRTRVSQGGEEVIR